MRAVVQRVKSATCVVGARETGAIGAGLLVFLGVERGDVARDREWLAAKLAGLRVFPDAEGRMNVSLRDHGGGLLLIPQFTLFGDVAKGMRPSFSRAEEPGVARATWLAMAEDLAALLGRTVGLGEFGADMTITAVNDGPVTLVLDSRREG